MSELQNTNSKYEEQSTKHKNSMSDLQDTNTNTKYKIQSTKTAQNTS